MICSFLQCHPCLAPGPFGLGKATAAILSTATIAAFPPRVFEKQTEQQTGQRTKEKTDPRNNLAFEHAATRLQLRSPEIKPFLDDNLAWDGWMVTSAGIFLSTGFGHIVADDFVGPPDDLCEMVCAQISNACHKGHSE